MVSDSPVERFMRQWSDHVLEAGRHAQGWSDAFFAYRERMIVEFFDHLPPDSDDLKRPN